MPKNILSFLLVVMPALGWAQSASVEGRVLDSRSRLPISGAHVKLADVRDTTRGEIVTTGSDGRFRVPSIAFGSYVLAVTCIGYTKVTRTIRAERPRLDLGDIGMMESAIRLTEVVVEGVVPPAVQKADTTEFNARAFRTNPDAVAEDLVAKMPGITVENGTVKAQGEDIQRVLVDGKPFFGDDPTLALRNLPAEVIDKIQVFDKMSDQAEFTGFDDGQSVKTMNVITRPERRNGQFGKSYGGYGEDQRYLAGGNLNIFQNETRVSVIGLANNVNQQNFSTQDLLGVVNSTNQRGGFPGGGTFGGRRSGRGGFGGGAGGGFQGGGPGAMANFLVGQQNGITSTNSLGANYSSNLWDNLVLHQSYFFNATDNTNNQSLRRQYVPTQDSVTLYNEQTDADSRNYNHRVDSRIEYAIDSSNSFIAVPRLYFQNNDASSAVQGMTSLTTGELLDQAENNNRSNSYGNNLSMDNTYRHKFDIPGRTLSLSIRAATNHKKGSGNIHSFTAYGVAQSTAGDTLDQQSASVTDGSSVSSRLAYTEPIAEDGLVQITYNPSFSRNTSDTRKYDFSPVTGTYSDLDANLSNTFDNTYSTHNVGLGYRLRGAGFNVMTDLVYQFATLRGEQTFPRGSEVSRVYHNLLPSAAMNFNFGGQGNLRVMYRTSTKEPTIGQLQGVVDNSNPLLLSTGNPDLRPSYTHTLISRFSQTSSAKARSLFALLSLSYANNYIGTSTFSAQRDTVLPGGVVLTRGTQLTFPVNADGYWNMRSFLTYGIPVELIMSNMNFNAGFTFSRTPGTINGLLNKANAYVASAGVVIGSNISEEIDFTLSYTGNYTISRNTLEPDLNSTYYNHVSSLKLNLIFGKGIVFRGEMSNVLYSGLSASYDKNYTLVNLNVAKKLLDAQRGEIRVGVTDLLDQNKSVSRTVTETYTEDSENRVLGRYLMVMLTYTFR